MSEPAWQPLLTAELDVRARRIVDAITVALRDEPIEAEYPSISSGYLGAALYFGYLDRLQPSAGHTAIGEALRDRAIDDLAQTWKPPGLHYGVSGVAWAVEHLQGDELDEEDANSEIDEALVAFVDGVSTRADFDLMNGLTGIGVYAIERSRRPSGRALLARVVARLAEMAEPRDGGLAWHTHPENEPAASRALYPNGFYNLGVAHGPPAVVLVLAGACALRVSGARPLLNDAMRWLLARRRGDNSSFVFPMIELDDGRSLPPRAAWCYGDAGVSVTLLATARAASCTEWETAALAAAERAAARPAADCGVADAGVCHGAAGLALMFHRLWHSTGDARFAAAARHWYEHTLDLHQPGRGVGGYEAWLQPSQPGARGTWEADRSLLSGAAGIGLVLMAGLGIEPRWDRMLASSLPPWAKAS